MNGPTPSGEVGIARSQQSAEHSTPGWTEMAALCLCGYAQTHDTFTIEEARAAMSVPEPPELRAWGSATQMAQRRGWIERTGTYRQATSSNGSEKPVYRRGTRA